MTAPRPHPYLPACPYPGIEPFSYAERNVFFVRDSEVRTLIRLVVMYRGVLLYADSGTGKSSLINAGLIPLAIEEGYQPEKLRLQPRHGEEIIAERLPERMGEPGFLPSIFASDDSHERVVMSVEKFLWHLREGARSVRPLLIFDQFEEWVTLFEESAAKLADELRAMQDRIKNAITGLINDTQLPVKILISLREDYLAKINPFVEQCPTLSDQYLRLTPPRREQILKVIRGPFESHPGRYPVELSVDMAGKIQAELEARSEGSDIRLTEVQIVCRRLFESERQGAALDQFFLEEGGVQGILQGYLERTLDGLPAEQRECAIGLLSRMVTPAGTRNVISRDDLVSRVALEDAIPHALVTQTLDSLERRTKLVRRERRREVYYYEIASEFLVEWILRKATEQKRLTEQRKLAALEEQRRLQEQARAAVRLRRFVIALAIVSMLAVAAAVSAVLAKKTADARRVEAERARLEADLAKDQARSRALAWAAITNLEVDPQLSVLLALYAVAATYSADRKTVTPEAEDALQQAVGASRTQLTQLGIGDLLALARARVERALTPEECQRYLKLDTCPPTP